MDVWEYFETKRREIIERSSSLDDGFLFVAEADSDDQRGRVWGRAILNDRAFLNISETVVVEGSGIHREDYAYYLIVDGGEVWGYERDPSHEPAVHQHVGADHARKDAEPVSLVWALEEAWRAAELEDSWSPPPEPPD